MTFSSSPIPTRLLVPGDFDEIADPVKGPREQHLPLNELSFENFQRLSVKLLTASKNVIHCQEYGTPGQKQHGIDLFARLPDQEKLEVWQCKKYEEFIPSDIKNAVDEFLVGKFVDSTHTFVLVTSACTEDSKLADAYQEAEGKLKKRNVQFSLHGKTKLSSMLKEYPEIIDDFFRRSWVEALCGTEVAKSLRKRLTGKDVKVLREDLHNLYHAVFERNDSFVASAFGEGQTTALSLSIAQRWVMPSITCRPSSELFMPTQNDSIKGDANQGYQTANQSKEKDEPPQRTGSDHRKSLLDEFDADTFIGSSNRLVILGDPGFGKSALLRVVALDLLSATPKLKRVAEKFGNHLPIWLPFAFLSKKISEGLSPADSAWAWLHLNGAKQELDDLVHSAMQDKRLLLLVDGLDEWSDVAVAKAGLTSIQGFLTQHQTACLITSRPLGYQKLERLTGVLRYFTWVQVEGELA